MSANTHQDPHEDLQGRDPSCIPILQSILEYLSRYSFISTTYELKESMESMGFDTDADENLGWRFAFSKMRHIISSWNKDLEPTRNTVSQFKDISKCLENMMNDHPLNGGIKGSSRSELTKWKGLVLYQTALLPLRLAYTNDYDGPESLETFFAEVKQYLEQTFSDEEELDQADDTYSYRTISASICNAIQGGNEQVRALLHQHNRLLFGRDFIRFINSIEKQLLGQTKLEEIFRNANNGPITTAVDESLKMTAQQIRDEFTGSEADWSSLSRSLNKEDDKQQSAAAAMASPSSSPKKQLQNALPASSSENKKQTNHNQKGKRKADEEDTNDFDSMGNNAEGFESDEIPSPSAKENSPQKISLAEKRAKLKHTLNQMEDPLEAARKKKYSSGKKKMTTEQQQQDTCEESDWDKDAAMEEDKLIREMESGMNPPRRLDAPHISATRVTFSDDDTEDDELLHSKPKSIRLQTDPLATPADLSPLKEEVPRKKRLSFYNKKLPSYRFEAQGKEMVRVRKRWSDDEVNALLSGLRQYSDLQNRWIKIKINYGQDLQDRTPIDLKDKYRNLKKTGKLPSDLEDI